MSTIRVDTVTIPKPFKKIFPSKFNDVQRLSFHDIWNTEQNIIIQAPTGSGKTVLAKISLLKTLLKPSRGIYVGPLRALNDEKSKELQELAEYNWVVKPILGGTYCSPKELESIDLLLTTPEKLLSLLYTMDLNFFTTIVFDEIHLLGEQKRGAYLEFIIMEIRHKYPGTKILGLSATIPNNQELSSWLQATPIIFGQEYRATKLDVKIIKTDQKKDRVAKLVKGYQIAKKILPDQVLVFSTSRANVQYYAKKFHEWSVRDNSDSHNEIMYTNKKLTELSRNGIAFYHAGLPEEDKKRIVEHFIAKHISILISTSSLAWGVNLPAISVIIMDIEYTNPLSGKEPMNSSDILQMLGRAGRPQYHSKGYGYVLANETQCLQIENMLEGKAPIVSSMFEYLPELVLHFLALEKADCFPRDELEEFFNQSFLVQSEFLQQAELSDELDKILSNLQVNKLIKVNSDKLTISRYGLFTSRFFIHPITAGNLLTIRPDSVDEILPFLHEFKELPVRKTEKKFLRSIGATPKTYQEYKLKYVISTLDNNSILEPEFMQDGSIIYKEYLRIQSFYNYIGKLDKKTQIELS